VLKDFLGVMTEEAVRKNFVLIYEILDEVIDGGVVQELGSERLRPYIFTDPVPVEGVEKPSTATSLVARIQRGDFYDSTRKANATNVSILSSSAERKNEIFVDVIERLNVVFSPSGSVVTAEVDGSVILKSFLAGSPDLFLGFNEDLVVGRDSRSRYATVILDSVNFHERADYSRFESERLLVMKPPDGEFVAMNYRISSPTVTLPFRATPSIELLTTYKAELTLRIRCDAPSTTAGINISVRVPMPKSTTSVAVTLGAGAKDQAYEYREAERTVLWRIPRFVGATEQVCKIRVSTNTPFTGATRRELGPIMMQFEVPNYNVSGLAIKQLKLEERSRSYNPQRWVRNIAQAGSYAFRVQ
jgi:AP-4 complex subunit mu-1